MGAHTPGPWTVIFVDGKPREIVVRAVYPQSPRHIINWNGLSRPASPESAANARLIAAAPDLLEALEELVAQASPDMVQALDETLARVDTTITGGRLDKARAAIAKARGHA